MEVTGMSSADESRSRVERLGDVCAFSIFDSIPLEIPVRSASWATFNPISWRRLRTWLAMTHPIWALAVSPLSGTGMSELALTLPGERLDSARADAVFDLGRGFARGLAVRPSGASTLPLAPFRTRSPGFRAVLRLATTA